MPTNITQKNKTLHEIIDWCTDLANKLRDAPDGDFYANINANLIKADTLAMVIRHILEKESEEAKPRHDEPKTMYSHERLEHERRKAWSEGYAAGWKDQECDFPQYTSENPYKYLLRKQQGREAGR